MQQLHDVLTVVFKPFNMIVVIYGWSALPAVCALIAGICRVAVITSFDKPIEIFVGFHDAFVNHVRLYSRKIQAAATVFCLPNE